MSDTLVQSLPANVAVLCSLWRRYLDQVTRHNEAISGMVREACQAAEIAPLYDHLAPFGGGMIRESDLTEHAHELRNTLIRLAEKSFGPVGAPLKIDRGSIKTPCDAEGFSPEALWRELDEKFGQDGATLAWRAVAISIRRLFREFHYRFGAKPGEDDADVVIVAGRPVLTVPIYGCRIMERTYDYQDVDRVKSAVDALCSVMAWAGMDATDCDFAPLKAAMEKAGSGVVARMNLGANIQVVPFKSKLQFRISPELGTQLRLFLSEFTPRDEES